MFSSLDIQQFVLFGCMTFLSFTIFFCLLRAVLGPRLTDRIVAVNVVGTKVIVFLCILALAFDEPYLTDIALIYAIASFLSVIVLTKAILNVASDGSQDNAVEGENR